jgi:TatD DNase family protein
MNNDNIEDIKRTTNPYVDLHAHLQFPEFDLDRDDILDQMRKNNVVAIDVGVDEKSSRAGIELAKNNQDLLWSTVGLHPLNPDDNYSIEDLLRDENLKSNICGIGECGLDYFRIIDEENQTQNLDKIKDFQKEIFINQIKMSIKYDFPLMLHVRDSYRETLEILYENFKGSVKEYKGNVHFFAGNIDEAKAFLDLGFSISFTGVVTFVPSYEELIRFVPIEHMFAETDSPYVSPKPFRGQRNNPNNVIEVYKKIAEIKGISLDEVIDTLYYNAKKHWLR